ncbi:MAG: response regulator [Planctomycetes bacterium]|nr:response regulator [Planctomycetota bacterium]
MRVLIVDDDDIALATLERTLANAGYEVLLARSGEEALEALRDSGCRLIVSDWMMPGMSGIELCRRIRAEDHNGYRYIILVTSRRKPNDVVEGLSAGADDFLTKPVNPAELRVRVRAGRRVLALETRDLAIFAMARLVESRHPETGAHLERIRNYARALAQSLSQSPRYRSLVDAEYVRLVYLTSPLHDIGKVGIPDSVLRKPGRLTEREFEIMKSHTRIGAETLEAALRQYPDAAFLQMARDIALTHHERWDGGGYPQGLQGPQIPLCGRIVALADVYDALSSKRSYKDAHLHGTALSLIVGERGTHFDPDVVDAFLECEPAFLSIRRQFADNGGSAASGRPAKDGRPRRTRRKTNGGGREPVHEHYTGCR